MSYPDPSPLLFSVNQGLSPIISVPFNSSCPSSESSSLSLHHSAVVIDFLFAPPTYLFLFIRVLEHSFSGACQVHPIIHLLIAQWDLLKFLATVPSCLLHHLTWIITLLTSLSVFTSKGKGL